MNSSVASDDEPGTDSIFHYVNQQDYSRTLIMPETFPACLHGMSPDPLPLSEGG